jgi:hypothetical protein
MNFTIDNIDLKSLPLLSDRFLFSNAIGQLPNSFEDRRTEPMGSGTSPRRINAGIQDFDYRVKTTSTATRLLSIG